MSQDPDAAELAESALRGSRAAWERLMDLHGHAVVRSLVARGISVDKARDLAQSAWARLLQQQQDGKLSSLALPGLAIAQAGFFARDELRRTRPSAALEEAAQIGDAAADPEARALTREQIERTRRALADASKSAQEIFRLVYGEEGLSHDEVASRVGLSVQRVRQVLCQLRKRLRAELEESDHV